MSKDESPPKCPNRIAGSSLNVVHCLGAWDSFAEALRSVQVSKHNSTKNQLDLLVKRLANGERLSKDSFPPEGPLPSNAGKPAKQFYAFKKIPIRAYGWYSDRFERTFFISHYIYKSKGKLSKKDTTKVQANWKRIEVDGDEK